MQDTVNYRIKVRKDVCDRLKDFEENMSSVARTCLSETIEEREGKPVEYTNVSIRIDQEMLSKAKELNINVADTLRSGIERTVFLKTRRRLRK